MMNDLNEIDDAQRGLAKRERPSREWSPPSPTECPSYQGPFDASPPEEGYTYYTQRAIPGRKTGKMDPAVSFKELVEWEVTVYYTNVEDPLAPLKPVIYKRIESAHDLRKKRIQHCEYWKEKRGRESTKWEKVIEDRIEDIPQDDQRRAAFVIEEDRIRAVKRKQRQEKVKELDAARHAEKKHMGLIEEERRRNRLRLREKEEREARREAKTKSTARMKAQSKVAQRDEELLDLIKGKESLKGEDMEKVATGYRAVATTFVDNATEPKHLAEALEMMSKSQTHSSEEMDAIFNSASAKQAEFIEETIGKILTKPHDASIKIHKKYLDELGRRIKLYMLLPGADEAVQERAKTKFYRLAREIRELEERKTSQSLQGKTQIDDPKRGLDHGSRVVHR